MKLVHLSDLHFGTEELCIVHLLEKTINQLEPGLIVASGDFTQRARRIEFTHAQDFLKRLNAASFCVPGNHDIPPIDLLQRFTNPYKRYRDYISDDISPVWEDDKIVMAGLNSTRPVLPHWNWANGALSAGQREKLGDVFDPCDPRWSICVFHHPIHKVDAMPLDVTVFGHKQAMETIESLKVDLVLTGHVHHASITTMGDENHQTVYVSASTALSSRLRGQENGFNVITLDEHELSVEIYKLIDGEFSVTDTLRHSRRR